MNSWDGKWAFGPLGHLDVQETTLLQYLKAYIWTCIWLTQICILEFEILHHVLKFE